MKKTQEPITLDGPAGPLEGRLLVPEGARAAAVVAHPHPLYGGTMDNAVVTETARSLSDHGAAVVCFNFRGVGRSAGRHDDGVGERLDLEAAVAELDRRFPGLPYLLAGYSFGAYIVLLSLRGPEPPGPGHPLGLLALAPPVASYDFSFLSGSRVPLAVVCGDADPLTPRQKTQRLLEDIPGLTSLEFLPHAGHDLGTASGATHVLGSALAQAVEGLLGEDPRDPGS